MKTSGIGFKELPKLKELDPGITALGFKILVLPKEIEEKTAGGIYIAKHSEGNIHREEEAGSEGLLVSMGPMAGNERWAEGQVKPGDVVCFARYAGKHAEFTGDDGRTYRLMNDEDVLGVRQAAKTALKAVK